MPSPVNINDTFFESSYKEVWKKLIPPGVSEIEASFIEDVVGIWCGKEVEKCKY